MFLSFMTFTFPEIFHDFFIPIKMKSWYVMQFPVFGLRTISAFAIMNESECLLRRTFNFIRKFQKQMKPSI